MTRILTRVRSGKKQRDADSVLIERVNRWIAEGAAFCSDIHERCEENNKFAAGEQWSEGDARAQANKQRPAMPMNKMLQVVNAVANKEIMNRYVSKVYPRSREDAGWAEAQDEFLRWQRDLAEVEHEESMAFRSLVSSGYAAVHTYYDPLEDDGRGIIMLEELPIWGLLWDTRARKQNLVDRRWHIHGKYISKDEAQEEYGDISPSAKRMFRKLDAEFAAEYDYVKSNNHTPGRWSWDSVSSGKWYNRAEEEIFVVEVEWRDVKTEYKAAVPIRLEEFAALQSDPMMQVDLGVDQAGQPVMLSGDLYAQMDETQQDSIREMLLGETAIKVFPTIKELDAFAEQYRDTTGLVFEDYAKQKRYCYRYAVISSDVVLEEGERPQGFTYEFLTGFPRATREGTTFFGIVDVGKGPQDWRNTLMSLVLTRLATSPKASFTIEEGSVENMDQFLDQVANPRAGIRVPAGFNSSSAMKEMRPPTFPPLERELLTMADQGVGEVAGLSGLDTGSQGDLRRISGNVVQSVKEASNTILALLFDALRRYRKRNAKLVLRYMRDYYDPAEVAEIVGPEKGQWIPPAEEWPDHIRFNVKVDEAPTSTNERMELFDFLTRTGTLQEWTAAGLLPIDLIMEWVPFISEQDRMRIKQYRDETQQDAMAMEQLQAVQQYLMSTPEGAAILEEMQAQGVLAPVDPGTEAPPAEAVM